MLLAPTELVGIALAKAGERNQLEQFGDALGSGAGESVGDVLGNGEVGKKGKVLKDNPGLALLGGEEVKGGGYFPVELLNEARIRSVQSGNEAE